MTSHHLARAAAVFVVGVLAACEGTLPPPPGLSVTSPERGLVQNGTSVTVRGVAVPGPDGDLVSRVVINDTPATLHSDGSFEATVTIEEGASMLETTAFSVNGGMATDARSVHVGQLRPVDSLIDHAVIAGLSADGFAKLSAKANDFIKTLDLPAMLAPMQPVARLGDGNANAAVSVTGIRIGQVKLTIMPTDAGLMFSGEVDDLDIGAKVDYAGTFVPDGSKTVHMTATSIVVAGTLQASPSEAGFHVAVMAPTFRSQGLHLATNGIIGTIVGLLEDNLTSTINKTAQSALEKSLEPMLNDALAQLSEQQQQFVVLEKTVTMQAAPSSLDVDHTGALIGMDLGAMIEGSETSPGFIYVPNGVPQLDPSKGVTVAISDDLLNSMLAQVHALGLFDIKIAEDFGYFDQIEVSLKTPPMVSANTADGSLRLMVGDAVATVSAHGSPLATAAINAQIDVAVDRGERADQIALRFGEVRVFVNMLVPEKADSPDGPVAAVADTGMEAQINSVMSAGLGVHLENVGKFLFTVPTPVVAGSSLDNLEMHTDQGFVVVSAAVH